MLACPAIFEIGIKTFNFVLRMVLVDPTQGYVVNKTCSQYPLTSRIMELRKLTRTIICKFILGFRTSFIGDT